MQHVPQSSADYDHIRLLVTPCPASRVHGLYSTSMFGTNHPFIPTAAVLALYLASAKARLGLSRTDAHVGCRLANVVL